YGPKPVWIGEYGYETRPPDNTFGVSYVQQAAYLRDAVAIARANPRIDLLIWFLVKDETRLSGWQSGFITAGGTRKPSFYAFARLRERSAGDRLRHVAARAGSNDGDHVLGRVAH